MKRTIVIIATLLIASAVVAQPPKERPTVAVVLSGGGAKGMAHIAVLKAVEEAGIPIDIVCGTSIGSLVGALYCVGHSPDYIDSLVRAQNWSFLLSDRTDPALLRLRQREEQNTYALIRGLSSARPEQGGLIRGRNLNVLFRRLCAGYLDSISFDSLPVRFACVATDIVTNTEVDFHSGYLLNAIRASMAIPGVFTPVRMGDMVLIDGGLRNNFPVDVARRMCADIVIGVTVQNDLPTADEINDAVSVMNQIIDVNCKNKYDENVEDADVFIKVNVKGYSAASFTPAAIDTLIRRGQEAVAEHCDDLLAVKARIDGSSKGVHGDAQYRPQMPREREFRAVNDTLTVVAGHRKRPDNVKLPVIVSAGFRFDSEEMGAIQLAATLPFNTRIPMGMQAWLRLGKRIRGHIEYTALTRYAFNPSVAYTININDIDVYKMGDRTYNFKYRHHQGDFTPLLFQYHSFTVQAGVRWDYFDYYGNILSITAEPLDTENRHYVSYRATADMNTEDHWYFPAHGMRTQAAYSYRTDNLIGMNNTLGLSDISVHWRANVTPLPRFTIQPMLYGRLLLGTDIPLCYRNVLGSEWFGQQVEQQMPFAGIGHAEYVERHFVGAQLQLQYRIRSNHYVLARIAAAHHSEDLRDMVQLPTLFGAQLGYSYNTLFGPIDLRVGYSNRTEKIYLFLNIGHRF